VGRGIPNSLSNGFGINVQNGKRNLREQPLSEGKGRIKSFLAGWSKHGYNRTIVSSDISFYHLICSMVI
jgi:hypothetical protein